MTTAESLALREAAQDARRIVDHFQRDGSLDFLRHWRACAIWLEKRAAAIEAGEDPALVGDPYGELLNAETVLWLPEENDWLLDLFEEVIEGCMRHGWQLVAAVPPSEAKEAAAS